MQLGIAIKNITLAGVLAVETPFLLIKKQPLSRFQFECSQPTNQNSQLAGSTRKTAYGTIGPRLSGYPNGQGFQPCHTAHHGVAADDRRYAFGCAGVNQVARLKLPGR